MLTVTGTAASAPSRAAAIAAHAFGRGDRLGEGRAGHQGGELVTAEAADDVVRPQATAELLRHVADRRVAGGVAVPVVDRLEVVEVEQQHAEPPAGAAGLRDGAGEGAEEDLAAHAAGEAVDRGRLHSAA